MEIWISREIWIYFHMILYWEPSKAQAGLHPRNTIYLKEFTSLTAKSVHFTYSKECSLHLQLGRGSSVSNVSSPLLPGQCLMSPLLPVPTFDSQYLVRFWAASLMTLLLTQMTIVYSVIPALNKLAIRHSSCNPYRQREQAAPKSLVWIESIVCMSIDQQRPSFHIHLQRKRRRTRE